MSVLWTPSPSCSSTKLMLLIFSCFNVNYYLKPNIYLAVKQVKPAIIDLPVD